jgi:putative Holliday junction resolvase
MVRFKSQRCPKVYLGIDYGSSKVGIAFGRDGSVFPLRTVSGKNLASLLMELRRLILDYDVTHLVLGLPLDAQGKDTPKSLEVRKFGKLLRKRLGLPVLYVDEHHSSKDAQVAMLDFGVSRKARRVDDSFAAAVILKRFFHTL